MIFKMWNVEALFIKRARIQDKLGNCPEAIAAMLRVTYQLSGANVAPMGGDQINITKRFKERVVGRALHQGV